MTSGTCGETGRVGTILKYKGEDSAAQLRQISQRCNNFWWPLRHYSFGIA